jgi:hypothetical protein
MALLERLFRRSSGRNKYLLDNPTRILHAYGIGESRISTARRKRLQALTEQNYMWEVINKRMRERYHPPSTIWA